MNTEDKYLMVEYDGKKAKMSLEILNDMKKYHGEVGVRKALMMLCQSVINLNDFDNHIDIRTNEHDAVTMKLQ